MIIRIVSPEGGKDEFELLDDIITIGRGKNCDIVLADDHISRKHLEIKNIGGLVYIKDLTLSNWVSYNDEKLPKELDVQYYDFAPLLLPGSYKVEIELDSDQDMSITNHNVDMLKDELKPVSMAVNTQSAELKEFAKIEKENIARKNSKKKTKTLKKEKKKSKNELMVFAFITLGAIAYVIYESVINVHTPVPPKLKKIKKVIPSERVQVVSPTQKIENDKAQETKESTKTSKTDLLLSEKCQSPIEKVFCSVIFKNSSDFEGVKEEGRVVHVYKNLVNTALAIFGDIKVVSQLAAQNKNLTKAIAGQYIILPSFLEAAEKNNKSYVEIHLFNKTVDGPKVIHSYVIDVADYRKFDAEDYPKAYELIKNKDFSYFNKELSEHIKVKK